MKKVTYMAPVAEIYGAFEDVIASSLEIVETTPAVTDPVVVPPVVDQEPEYSVIPGGSLLDGGAGFGEEQNYIK